ncbi:hypothetical protein ABPG72_007258 [Tetrahymena utriculariae]
MFENKQELEDALCTAFQNNQNKKDLQQFLHCVKALDILCKLKGQVKLKQLISVLCRICQNVINKDDYEQNQILKLNCYCNNYCHKLCLKQLILLKKDEFKSLERIEEIINENNKCDHGCFSNIFSVQMIKQVLSAKEIQMYEFNYSESQKQKEINEQQILELQKQKQVIEFECSICCEELDLNQNGYILKCGCQFCRDCLKQCIVEALNGNINLELENIFCPMENCKKVLDFEDINFILKDDRQMIDKLEQKNIISMFQKAKRENPDSQEILIICPGKYKVNKNDNSKILIIPQDQIEKQRQGKANIALEENEIIVDCNLTFILDRSELKLRHKCTKCKYQFCLNNCDSIHENSSCSDYQKWKIENTKDYRKELEAQGYRFCPNKDCCVITYRIDGCNRITCTSCQISYCFLCYFSAKTANEVYAHLNQKHGGYWGNV